MKHTLLISSLIAAGTLLAACGSMDNQSGRRGHGPNDGNRDAMRQAAVAACANQAEGTAVKLTTPRGENLDATCTKSPRTGELQAMPNQMLERMRAMEQACVGKKAGDNVTITSPRDASKTMPATCEMRGDKLMANFGKPPRDGLKPMPQPAQ